MKLSPDVRDNASAIAVTAAAVTDGGVPGDEVTPGTPGSGDNTCPRCAGTGRLGDSPCGDCDGTGVITTNVGDA